MRKITQTLLLTCILLLTGHFSYAQCNSANYIASNCSEFGQQTVETQFASDGPQNTFLAAAGDTYYLRSNTQNPWSNTTNQNAMNTAFGAGNWTEVFFQTVDPVVLFSSATRFVFIEGSDASANALNTFLSANLTLIENWVATGKTVLINAAPNEGGNINFGFGGTTLLFPDFSNSVTVVDTSHPIFTGPHLPVSQIMTGNSYGHAAISGTGYTNLIVDSATPTRVVLAEKNWGNGIVAVGGMTTTNFHSPDPTSFNLRANLLVYLESQSVPNIFCPADIVVNNDSGTCGAIVTFANATATDSNGDPLAVTQTAGPASGSVFQIGETLVEFTADDNGTIITCSFTVTVNDTEAPSISCPLDIIQSTDVGSCSAVVNYMMPSTTDNCITSDNVIMSGQVSVFSGNARGYTFTAPSDFIITGLNVPNTASNDGQNVMVMRFSAAVPNFPAVSGYEELLFYTNEVAGNDYIPVNIAVNAGDIIGILGTRGVTNVNSYTSQTSINIFGSNVGITRFLTQNGINPSPAPQGTFSVEIGNPSVSRINFEYSSSTLSGITQTAGLASGSEFPIGTTTNTFEVTDASGNTATCSFDVTVEDNEAPVALCVAPFNLALDANGAATLTTAMLDNGSTDNCNDITYSFTETGTAFAEVNENQNLTITLPTGAVVQTVDFASYGTPNGSNGNYTIGGCHAGTSQSVVESYALGNNSFTIPALNGVFGDPCNGTPKRLYVTVSYTTVDTELNFSCADLGDTTVTLTVTDASGNSATCSTVVTIIDDLSPEITCVSNQIIDTDAGACTYTHSGNAWDATAIDNCSIASTTYELTGATTGTGTTLDGVTFNLGETTVTWITTDGSGNTADCSFTVTVEDNEAPVITCPGNITQANDPGVCGAVVNYTVTATDNCSGVGACITEDFETYVIAPNNAQSLSGVMVLDENTVVNGQGPGLVMSGCTYSSLDGEIQWNGAGYFGQVNRNIVAGGSDSTIRLEYDATVGAVDFNLSAFDGYSDTATIEAFDISGISLGVVGPLAIPDATPVPVSFAIAGIKTIVIVGTRGWSPLLNDHVFCPDSGSITPVQTAGLPSGSTFPIGTTTNTFVVTDDSGNTTTCSFTVTVEDTEAPQITCVADQTMDTDAGACTYTHSGTAWDATATDNCSIATTEYVLTGVTTGTGTTLDGVAFNLGETTVTWTTTDGSDNTADCSFTVTVEDNEAPVIACVTNQTVDTNAGVCTYTHSGNTWDATATDNCSIATIEYELTGATTGTGTTLDGVTFNIGETTVTWTTTDGSGNTDDCSFTVTVEDNEAPQIACVANQTVDTDFNVCTYTHSGTAWDATATDNCSIVTTEYELTGATTGTGTSLDGVVFNIGLTTVTWTTADGSGNTADCMFTVTVEDNQAPQIVCPLDIIIDADPGMCNAQVFFGNAIALDACSGFLATVQTAGPASGSFFPVGDTVISFSATDAAGNVATCSFTITVEDNQAPLAVCQNITIQLDADGVATISAEDLNGGSTDNCAGILTYTASQTSFDCSNVGENTITLTVTDEAGNSSTCTAIVTVEDTIAPVAMCATPFTIQLDASGNASITVADIDNGSSDNCSDSVITLSQSTFTCADLGENTITLTITDASGNTATCTTVVTLEDTIAPIVSCIDFTLELGPDGTALLTPEDIGGTSTDNCAITITAIDVEEFDCSDIGTPVLVTYFASDASGNIASCTAMVTVVDMLGPVIDCPEDQTVDTDPESITYTLPDYFGDGLVTATDNCTDPVTIFSQTPAPGTLLLDGTYTITLTATDEYGNETVCEFELTVDTILGAEDNSLDFSSLTMYPNPAEYMVTIGNPKFMAIDNINVYDIQGRLVLSKNTAGATGNQTLEVGHLASAVYMVVIESNGKQAVKRLIRK